MGKSLIKKLQEVGGQNPIEAAKMDCRIYHGPFVYNFKEIYELFKFHNISEEINGERELAEKLLIDLKSSEEKKEIKSEIINNLGNEILQKSLEEIKGIFKSANI